MTREELQERIQYWIGANEYMHDVLDVIDKYAAERRSEGYSQGWDDGYEASECMYA